MKWIVGILIAGAVLVALLVAAQQHEGPIVVSGFVEADEIRVGSRIGGRVAEVHVDEGQVVSKGDLLVELEPFDLRERLAEAEQQLAQVAAAHDKAVAGFRAEEIAEAKARRDQVASELDKLRNGPRPQEIAAAEASVRLAQSELQLAKRLYDRTEKLFGRQAADRNELDIASNKLSVAQASVDEATEQLALLKEGTRTEDIKTAEARLDEASQQLALRQAGFRSEDVREAKARRDAANAAVEAIRKQLRELRIVAPCDSVVDAIELRPGDLVAPNAPSVSLTDLRRLWVRAYVPENRLNLKTGQQLTLRIDSFPGREFTGEVIFVARQAEFTPGNVQTPEERSKQVFRIKVLLSSGVDIVRPGMAADVVLSLGD